MSATTTPQTSVYPITVDYSQSLDQMVAECGCDYNDPDITATNFPLRRGTPEGGPISGQDTVDEDIILLHFGHDIESGVAIEEMKKLGLEPARIKHALAFGKKYPNKQREFPIVFLGSSRGIGGSRRVPCLGGLSGERDLDLIYFGSGWDGGDRFAAVRQPANATLSVAGG